MVEGVQSLWYSYMLKGIEESEEDSGIIYGIKCHGSRLKNGELAVAVAKYLIAEHSATAESMSEYFSVTARSVNVALKKIRDRFNVGMAIPGLNEIEAESVFLALSARDEFRKETQARRGEGVAVWNTLIGIMREHVVSRMFNDGNRIEDIAGVVGISKKKVKHMIGKLRSLSSLIVEMYREGKSIKQISDSFDVSKREIQEALKGAGYNLKVIKQFTRMEADRHTISTIKPSKPKNNRKPFRRVATISREGLANWNRLYYDNLGRLRLPYGCAPPADLPRKFPSTKVWILPIKSR